MDFSHSEKVRLLQEKLQRFMDAHVYPAEPRFEEEVEKNRHDGNPWRATAIVEELKRKARAENLWNLFLPHSEHGAGLSNLEYAPLCEIMGRSHLAPEAFNCSAPDTGNMEVLARYATPEQQQRWLVPLLDGRGLVDGAPAAYVCRQFTCQAPVTTPEQLREALAGLA